jgi:hypothetical protein
VGGRINKLPIGAAPPRAQVDLVQGAEERRWDGAARYKRLGGVHLPKVSHIARSRIQPSTGFGQSRPSCARREVTAVI